METAKPFTVDSKSRSLGQAVPGWQAVQKNGQFLLPWFGTKFCCPFGKNILWSSWGLKKKSPRVPVPTREAPEAAGDRKAADARSMKVTWKWKTCPGWRASDSKKVPNLPFSSLNSTHQVWVCWGDATEVPYHLLYHAITYPYHRIGHSISPFCQNYGGQLILVANWSTTVSKSALETWLPDANWVLGMQGLTR